MQLLKALWFALVLSIFLVPSALAVDYGDILSAETRTGSIDINGQTDSFTFSGDAGQTTVISMSAMSGSGVDPQFFLYAPDGTIETDSNCGGRCSHTEINNNVLLQTGTYTIVVSDYQGNETGGYSLSLLLIPGPTVSLQDTDGGDILSGEAKTGIIDFGADTDAFTFYGKVGETLPVISMSAMSGSGVDPQFFLYAPDGTIETDSDCGGRCSHTEINNHVLLQTGTYTIVCKDYQGNETGSYGLSLTKIPALLFSPSVRIILNQSTFTTGEELIIEAHVVNGPTPVDVEVKLWINTPSSIQQPLFDSHFTFTVGANADFTVEIFRYTFGADSPGDYDVGGRFLNPISGREISTNVESYSYTP